MNVDLEEWMYAHGWVFFRVPAKIIKEEPRNDSPLLRLPNEMLLEIFTHVNNASDQICLALSCKRFLQVGTILMNGIKMPSVVPHRRMPPAYRPQMIELLRRLCPRDSLGRRRQDVALCYDCLQYRTIRTDLWHDHGQAYRALEPKADTREAWNGNLSRWRAKYSSQCPDCCVQARREELYRERTGNTRDILRSSC